MNFDEMDIEPKSEPSMVRNITSKSSDMISKVENANDEELQSQLLLRTVPLDDGSIGYVFTCFKNGPIATWRCHVCNFVENWGQMKIHLDSKWHNDNMLKYHHLRSNFTKVGNTIQNISKGQPLPPGMEDEITGPCQILKALETFDQPLIGLEYLLEMHIIELKEPRYLCLLCDKRGDPRSILVHLTSHNHYIMYLRKYFRRFYSLIDKLPKSNECRGSVGTVTSHLIAKLDEKYGRLQPSATRDDVINNPEQRGFILQRINNSVHFSESAEDAYLEGMLTIEYVQNTQLLLKNFPLKPKTIDLDSPKDDPICLFNKSSKNGSKKQIRSRESNSSAREDSPDVVFIGASRGAHNRNGPGRDRSTRSRSRRRSRSPRRVSLNSRRRSRSPHRSRSPPGARGSHARRSAQRSRSPDREHRRYVSPASYRSLRYRPSRSPSPRRYRSSRSPPILERNRFVRRSPSPLSGLSRRRERLSPVPRFDASCRYRSRTPDRGGRRSLERHHRRSRDSDVIWSPEKEIRRSPAREIRRIYRLPSPFATVTDDVLRYRERSRSKDRSPKYRDRPRRSRSGSRPRRSDSVSNSNSQAPVSDSSNIKEKGRTEATGNTKSAYIREAKEVEQKLNKEMARFTETPESHPAYQEEWKKFWCAKFKELQSEGKEDPHKYDYKPEWIVFWNKRVKELFDEELKSSIKALKIKYEINDDRKSKQSPKEANGASTNSSSGEKKPVIDIRTMWKELTGCEIHDEPTAAVLSAKNKSVSSWEVDSGDEKGGDKSKCGSKTNASASSSSPSAKKAVAGDEDGCTQPISPESLSSISDIDSQDGQSPPPPPPQRRRKMSRSYSRSRSRSQSPIASRSSTAHLQYPFKDELRKPTKKIHFDNPLNIITVLRQLSVLEFQLGSYAGHIISLLTSGLTMERIKPQSSVDLLTKENVLFLELVKEKLKGQLLAGLVPKAMVKATLFCIRNVEDLLQLVPKLKPSAPPPIPAPPPALLYGAGVEPGIGGGGGPPGAPPYRPHAYGGPHMGRGGFKSSFKPHYDRGGQIKDRYPFSKTNSRQTDDVGKAQAADKVRNRSPDRYPFRNDDNPASTATEATPSKETATDEIPIDKNMIALQIAEVLTQQGRSDVSNEELQTLINTVVDSLRQEQKQKALHGGGARNTSNSLSITKAVTNATAASTQPAQDAPTIPAGFNINDVTSSTLALLQDAYASASVLNPAAPKPFAIEDLSEAEIIQLLRNFKSIPRVKQEKLIEYLRKLEMTNPDRVEELKKYVNVL